MPHEGYVDPIMNDESRFHLNVPVSELIERVARAIEASDVSLAPPVAETMDGVTHGTGPTLSTEYHRQSTEGYPVMVDLSVGVRVIRN